MGKMNSTKKNPYTLYYQLTMDMVTMIMDHYIHKAPHFLVFNLFLHT